MTPFYAQQPLTGGNRRRKPKHIAPRLLDWLCNGVPVYIRRRPHDGKVYATLYDYSPFIKEEPLEVVRVPIKVDTPKEFKPEEHPSVLKALERHK